MKIEKLYFTLGEVCERWRMPEVDVAYLAENGDLRVSVRVCRLPIEISSTEETAEGERFSLPHTHTRFSGVLDLHADDAFRVFRKRAAVLSHFLAADGDYVSILPDCEAVEVHLDDLLVRKEERDRYEKEVGFMPSAGESPAAPIVVPPTNAPVPEVRASADYREVRIGDEVFQLGPIQAEVVRALHAAQLAGDNRWQSGKAVLAAAGSKSMKMVDVFKSQPGWRRLIQSDHRGSYRLACGDVEAAAHPTQRGMGVGSERDGRGMSSETVSDFA